MTRKPFGFTSMFSLAAALLAGTGCGGTPSSEQLDETQAAMQQLASGSFFTKTSDWGSGFCGDLHVINGTGAALDGWYVGFTTASNVQLSSVWNGNWSRSGSGTQHSVKNLSWNAQVAAGGELTIGMCGNYSGTFSEPSGCTLNGKPCGDAPPPPPPPPPPTVDTTPPVVSISSSAITITSPQELSVVFSATDNVGVTGMSLSENGLMLGERTPYNRAFSSANQNGTYVYEARAVDAQGNQGTASLTVTVNISAEPPPPPPTVGPTEYAPYFYTWGFGNTTDYAFHSLMDLKSKSGLNAVTLAFVLGKVTGGNPCSITNDGATNLIQGVMKDDIQAFRAAGGKLKVSFGGANGLNLDSPQACATEGELFEALYQFVKGTGLKDLDFDVEQNEVLTPSVNLKRAKALRRLQQSFPDVKVSFTLAALPRDRWGTPGGLLPSGVEVVRSALQAGVVVSHLNLMTMDFGEYFSVGAKMGDLAVSAVTDAQTQLKGLIPGLTDAQAWAMLGATPMIGRNDIDTEVFRLEDALTLADFARHKGLGLVSFWAIQRDQPCPYPNLAVCSQVNTQPFQFHNLFRELAR